MNLPYAPSILAPLRRLTREVRVGDVRIGARNPVVLQSMTTPSTQDTAATLAQIERLAAAGCELVRVTTPNLADVENIPAIRAEMKKRGLRLPLAADVHFLPQIALKACEVVEKVRINPGNFADRKRFEVTEYSDAEYAEELERIRGAFLPVVRRAKELGVAMRIGTNHGSLSDRILNRYGDTPLGMVESALEFVRIARDEGYHDLVLSMKASNAQVMIQAYRLLTARMNELGMDYPLHLGVTEAGEGEDGRIKSAMGIGSLLSDGLGDTIRVSLTEDPEFEIPVAREIARLYTRPFEAAVQPDDPAATWDFYSYARRPSRAAAETAAVQTHVASEHLAWLMAGVPALDPPVERLSFDSSAKLEETGAANVAGQGLPVVLRLTRETPSDLSSGRIRFKELSIPPGSAWAREPYATKLADLLAGRPLWVRIAGEPDIAPAIAMLRALDGRVPTGVEVEGGWLVSLGRRTAIELHRAGLAAPIHLRYTAMRSLGEEQVRIQAAAEIGSLLCDGIGDSVEVACPQGPEFGHRLAFNLLQAARLRMTKTEYISCPSCGRTLFDLQETTARIRAQTNHLKGVKIAIMGCIVNGPGEMADADFGYVGSGPGYINLYVGKECVKRQIPAADADRALIDLIKAHGRWVAP
jgi:(E)-4-hydroxy-3-methylbut-2-enyl-diphosphate synthase